MNVLSFYIDEIGNTIVSDWYSSSLKFFSPEGDLFHKIGGDVVGSDIMERANDVVIYHNSIVVSCDDFIRMY